MVQSTPQLLPTPPLKLATIHVDDEHRQFEGGSNATYEIPSGIGLILDASGYEFKIPPGAKYKGPNMIQVMLDQNSFYGLPWKEGVTQYTLSLQTLNPMGNSAPLTGFYPGEDVVVAIGYQSDPENFYVLWAGILNIMEKQ